MYELNVANSSISFSFQKLRTNETRESYRYSLQATECLD